MNAPTRLAMLYSSPLIRHDKKGQAHPIELLDFKRERDIIFKSLKQTGMAFKIRSDVISFHRMRKISKSKVGVSFGDKNENG
jgi:hypothetical protein